MDVLWRQKAGSGLKYDANSCFVDKGRTMPSETDMLFVLSGRKSMQIFCIFVFYGLCLLDAFLETFSAGVDILGNVTSSASSGLLFLFQLDLRAVLSSWKRRQSLSSVDSRCGSTFTIYSRHTRTVCLARDALQPRVCLSLLIHHFWLTLVRRRVKEK